MSGVLLVVAFFQNFQVGVSFLGHMDCVLLKFQLAFVFSVKIRSASYCHNTDSLELSQVAYEKFTYLHALSPEALNSTFVNEVLEEKKLLHITFSPFGVVYPNVYHQQRRIFLGN
jgi:hypothetical protein